MIIRKSISEDAASVYEFICELEGSSFNYLAFCNIFEEHLLNPSAFCFSALENNQVIGFISCRIQNLLHHCGPVGEIQEFFIRKEFRNKGIGRLLMNEVLTVSFALSLQSLEVTFNRKRTDNVKVYENLGFRLTHHKLTMEPAVYMNHKL